MDTEVEAMARALVAESNHIICEFILQNGWYEGSHHKQWVLDQVLRMLSGPEYEDRVARFESKYGEWDTGISP